MVKASGPLILKSSEKLPAPLYQLASWALLDPNLMLDMSDRMQYRLSDRMSDKKYDNMSDKMSEFMSDKASYNICQDICHGGDHTK